MRRTLLYGLLVPVIAFEAAVAVMALNPRVSEPFRAYFIDRSTDCWRLDVSGDYALGETVSFLPPRTAAMTELMRCGWIGPQDTGLWSTGPEAELRIAVPGPPAPLLLELDVIPFSTTERPVQTIRISVNGRGLTTMQLEGSEPRKVEVTIPADYVALGDERIDVRFGFPSAYSPADVGLNADQRRLAIRLLSLRLTRTEAAPG